MSTVPGASDSSPHNPAEDQVPDGDLLDIRLTEEDLQAYYEAEYRRQLRRRQCPGCGEEDLF